MRQTSFGLWYFWTVGGSDRQRAFQDKEKGRKIDRSKERWKKSEESFFFFFLQIYHHFVIKLSVLRQNGDLARLSFSVLSSVSSVLYCCRPIYKWGQCVGEGVRLKGSRFQCSPRGLEGRETDRLSWCWRRFCTSRSQMFLMFPDALFKLYLKRRMMVAGNVILEQVRFCVNQR